MEDFEYIDQYLDGLLSAEEMAALERRRATDADFAEEFAWQKALRETVSEQAEIDDMAHSLMRRLEASGHFSGQPITPPQRTPFFRRRRFWWAVTVVGMCGLVGWYLRPKITDFLRPKTPLKTAPNTGQDPIATPSEKAVETNSIRLSSNNSSGHDSTTATIRVETIDKVGDLAQIFFERITEKTDNTASYPISAGINPSPALVALQKGDTTTAFQLCRDSARQNPDDRAFGVLDMFARQQFEKKHFVEAYVFFDALVRYEGGKLPPDERAQTLWRMFLCCAADWQRLNKEGRAVFPKIKIKNLPANRRNEPMRLRRALEQRGLW